MASTFGTLFRVSTFGESHGPAVGVVVDGCPSLLPFSEEDVQRELDRRRPGQSRITTQRHEKDRVEILSGVLDGVTLGTPIAMLVRNEDSRSRDYDEMRDKYRPSHADFAYDRKYGIRAWSGGGRASARETIGRVAAGALAQKLLRHVWGVDVVAWVETVAEIKASVDPETVSREQVEATIVRCPDLQTAEAMIERIEAVRKEGDTVGGVVGCVARNVPEGWGEPVFDKLEADLAKALMSLPASKGFEIGSGFAGTLLRGSQHNDPYRAAPDRSVTTPTNHSGGVQGGISIGSPITLRVAFKPVATILAEQETVNVHHENTTLKGRGRHDPCVLPRAVPMVEAMVALVLADHALRQRALAGEDVPRPPVGLG
ncbi:MAG: chorismate synthase [Fimbriimonadaceae bacterium]|nr:chorismate synthase [Fimbriimonadaceae bacterium]QYK55371.1 MAG: chorismate synthase [Fimbriimonadaceae bacterium]